MKTRPYAEVKSIDFIQQKKEILQVSYKLSRAFFSPLFSCQQVQEITASGLHDMQWLNPTTFSSDKAYKI